MPPSIVGGRNRDTRGVHGNGEGCVLRLRFALPRNESIVAVSNVRRTRDLDVAREYR